MSGGVSDAEAVSQGPASAAKGSDILFGPNLSFTLKITKVSLKDESEQLNPALLKSFSSEKKRRRYY